ncbi:MAG: DUF6691 family protein [Candidatus Binatia bacterium]
MNEDAKRLLGLATGLVFGALLQRGRLARHEVIMDQLLLRDSRVGRAMGTAVAVGAVGYQALRASGLDASEVKPMKVGGVVAGATLFGAGMALLGYCPGTSLAAVGEGQRDAVAGVAGMLAGAAAFVALQSKIAPLLEAGGDYGKLTLPEVTETSPWPWAAGIAGGTAATAALSEGAKQAL